MTTAGGLGEAEVGGPVVNMIPKTGGNTFQNHFYGSGMSGWMQSDNYAQITEGLRQRRRRVPAEDACICGTSACRSAGRSRRIGCGSSTPRRTRAAGARSPACTTTRTPATSTKWTYEPDFNRPAENGNSPGSIRPTLRLTAQVTLARQVEHVLGPEHVPVQRPRRRSAASTARPRARLRPARSPEGRAGSRAPTAVWSRSGGRRRRRTGCCSRPASAPTSRTGTGASGRGTIAT